MKILFLNSEAELHNNGGDKILLLTVEALAEQHDVAVLLPVAGPLVGAIRELGVACEVRPYPIVRRSTARPLAALRYVARLITSTFYLWRYVGEREIEVVYSNSLGVVQGCVLRLLRRCRNIWHIHDMIDRPAALNRLYSWLIAHGADIAICVSAAARDHLPIRRGNLRVVWNGIPPILPSAQFARLGTTATIGVLGRFNRLKGQADMVKAAAALREMGADFQVLLVGGTYRGDDAALRRVHELIAELDLAAAVRIAGARTDVAGFYRGVDLVVVPSVLLDPFPTVALEAMSAGKPVVAYASGGLPEMLGFDSNAVAPRGDVPALATLLARHMRDEPFRLSQAQRQHARYLENFTLPHYQERIRAAVCEVEQLGHHRRRRSLGAGR